MLDQIDDAVREPLQLSELRVKRLKAVRVVFAHAASKIPDPLPGWGRPAPQNGYRLETPRWENPPLRRHRQRLVLFAAALSLVVRPISAETLSNETASRLAELALACVHKEYPNKIAHVMDGDADAQPPRKLTPAFYGCYDWHSAVHGHWLLARLTRLHPKAAFAPRAREALAKSLTAENIATEASYLARKGRETFERPYGLAWLLALAQELREWDDPQARAWSAALAPLESAAAARIQDWLPKLAYPIREGEHNQTAFAFGLILDWARRANNRPMEELLIARTRELYLTDRACPINYEPSGQDFLSPCLAEADLMRRILGRKQFAVWLGDFLPGIPRDGSGQWLPVGIVTDRTDGKLSHLDGLNLSRAWMLEGIASDLPPDDPRLPALRAAAQRHRTSGLAAVTGEHYAGGHWLGTFATYLVTARGIAAAR